MGKSIIDQQISFINEVEKLKTVYRQNGIIDRSRQENSAEHSWHVALMAIVLKEYAPKQDIDLLKVIKMLLIHDIVEIDAGDTFLYDSIQIDEQKHKEILAAKRIFSLLPERQKDEFINLWTEFEDRKTTESIFANSLDGLQPLMNHYLTGIENENKHNIKKSDILKRKEILKDSSSELWELAEEIIEKSTQKGLYAK